MEAETATNIIRKSYELPYDENLTWLGDRIDKFLTTGEEQYFYLGTTDKEFIQLMELIGHDRVEGSQIIAYRLWSTAGESVNISNFEPKFKSQERRSILQIQETIANNLAGGLEFPNNFKVVVVISLDAETIMIYEHECDEQPNVCELCESDEDYSRSNNYSCDHMEDTIYMRNHATLMKRPELGILEEIVDSAF